jgi:hypothetical protein
LNEESLEMLGARSSTAWPCRFNVFGTPKLTSVSIRLASTKRPGLAVEMAVPTSTPGPRAVARLDPPQPNTLVMFS